MTDTPLLLLNLDWFSPLKDSFGNLSGFLIIYIAQDQLEDSDNTKILNQEVEKSPSPIMEKIRKLFHFIRKLRWIWISVLKHQRPFASFHLKCWWGSGHTQKWWTEHLIYRKLWCNWWRYVNTACQQRVEMADLGYVNKSFSSISKSIFFVGVKEEAEDMGVGYTYSRKEGEWKTSCLICKEV